MQTSVQETFKEISQVQENSSCFECGVPNCQWVSVNNGIFLCLACSNLHRGFGPSVSLIRSIALDSWSDEQLALMKNGGNAALWACFRNLEIPSGRPIDYKFRTKAGVYYREMLKAISHDQPAPEPPSKEEAAELAPIYQTSSTGEEKRKLSGTILEKITVESVAQGASDLGTSMVQGAKTIANKINDPNLTNNVIEYGASVGEKTYIAMEQSIEKTKEAWANRDELMTKVSDAAVQGWENTVKSTLGFWKKITGKKENQKGQEQEQEKTQQETNQGEIIQIQPEPSVQHEIPPQEEVKPQQEEEQKQE